MDVYGKDGQIVDDSDILDGLKYIVDKSVGPAEDVGFLTTESRNVWGVAYHELKKGSLSLHS